MTSAGPAERFIEALMRDDRQAMGELVAQGVNPNQPREVDLPGVALYVAALDAPQETVKLLLDLGARWEEVDPVFHGDIIHAAAKHNHPWLADALRAFIPSTPA